MLGTSIDPCRFSSHSISSPSDLGVPTRETSPPIMISRSPRGVHMLGDAGEKYDVLDEEEVERGGVEKFVAYIGGGVWGMVTDGRGRLGVIVIVLFGRESVQSSW